MSENLSPRENIQEIECFIQNHAEAFLYLKTINVTSLIDIGCTVGTPDQFTKSITAPVSFLALLSNYGIELEFSAYPVSE